MTYDHRRNSSLKCWQRYGHAGRRKSLLVPRLYGNRCQNEEAPNFQRNLHFQNVSPNKSGGFLPYPLICLQYLDNNQFNCRENKNLLVPLKHKGQSEACKPWLGQAAPAQLFQSALGPLSAAPGSAEVRTRGLGHQRVASPWVLFKKLSLPPG